MGIKAPVYFPDENSASNLAKSPNQLARFQDDFDQTAQSWGELSEIPKCNCDSIPALLSLPGMEEIIFNSNIFILGRVGFFDRIIDALKISYPRLSKIKTIRTENELTRKLGKKAKKSEIGQLEKTKNTGSAEISRKDEADLPFILLPTAHNQETLNRLITKALEANCHIWLIAIPSQIQPQLLLSFECFFLSPDPVSELRIFQGITPIIEADLFESGGHNPSKIVFVSNRTLENISEPDRLGTVAYINDFTV